MSVGTVFLIHIYFLFYDGLPLIVKIRIPVYNKKIHSFLTEFGLNVSKPLKKPVVLRVVGTVFLVQICFFFDNEPLLTILKQVLLTLAFWGLRFPFNPTFVLPNINTP